MSQTLLRTVSVRVILPVDPPNAGPAAGPFRTVYLLHGLMEGPEDWIANTNIVRWALQRKLAVVMPAGENSYYLDMPEIGLFQGRYVGEELVEMTRTMFPLSRRREDTFIGGFSMGGFGAMRNGLKYNQTFGGIISLSGAFHVLEDPGTRVTEVIAYEEAPFGDLTQAKESDKNPRWLIQKLAAERKKDPSTPIPRIYLACGTEDDLIISNRWYRDRMASCGWDLTYVEAPGFHNWDFWDTYIKEALDWVVSDGIR